MVGPLLGLLLLGLGLACFVLATRLTAPARRKARVWKRVSRAIKVQQQYHRDTRAL